MVRRRRGVFRPFGNRLFLRPVRLKPFKASLVGRLERSDGTDGLARDLMTRHLSSYGFVKRPDGGERSLAAVFESGIHRVVQMSDKVIRDFFGKLFLNGIVEIQSESPGGFTQQFAAGFVLSLRAHPIQRREVAQTVRNVARSGGKVLGLTVREIGLPLCVLNQVVLRSRKGLGPFQGALNHVRSALTGFRTFVLAKLLDGMIQIALIRLFVVAVDGFLKIDLVRLVSGGHALGALRVGVVHVVEASVELAFVHPGGLRQLRLFRAPIECLRLFDVVAARTLNHRRFVALGVRVDGRDLPEALFTLIRHVLQDGHIVSTALLDVVDVVELVGDPVHGFLVVPAHHGKLRAQFSRGFTVFRDFSGDLVEFSGHVKADGLTGGLCLLIRLFGGNDAAHVRTEAFLLQKSLELTQLFAVETLNRIGEYIGSRSGVVFREIRPYFSAVSRRNGSAAGDVRRPVCTRLKRSVDAGAEARALAAVRFGFGLRRHDAVFAFDRVGIDGSRKIGTDVGIHLPARRGPGLGERLFLRLSFLILGEFGIRLGEVAAVHPLSNPAVYADSRRDIALNVLPTRIVLHVTGIPAGVLAVSGGVVFGRRRKRLITGDLRQAGQDVVHLAFRSLIHDALCQGVACRLLVGLRRRDVVLKPLTDVERRNHRTRGGNPADRGRGCLRHHGKDFRRLHHVGRSDLFVDVVAPAHAVGERRKGVRRTRDKEEGDHRRRRRQHTARGDPVLKNLTPVVERVEAHGIGHDRRELIARAHQNEEVHDGEHGHPQLNPDHDLKVLRDHGHAEGAHHDHEGHDRRDRIDEAFEERHERSNGREEHRLLGGPLRVALLDGLIDHDGRGRVAHVVVEPLSRAPIDRFQNRDVHVVAGGNLRDVQGMKSVRDAVVGSLHLALRIHGAGKTVEGRDSSGILHRLLEAGLQLLPSRRTIQFGRVVAREVDLRAVDSVLERERVEAASVHLFGRPLTDHDLHHGALANVVVEALSQIRSRTQRLRSRIEDRRVISDRANGIERLQSVSEGMFRHAVDIAVALFKELRDSVAHVGDERAGHTRADGHVVDGSHLSRVGVFDVHGHGRAEHAEVAEKAQKDLVKVELSGSGHHALDAHDEEPQNEADGDKLLEVARSRDHGERIQNLRQEGGIADGVNGEHRESRATFVVTRLRDC